MRVLCLLALLAALKASNCQLVSVGNLPNFQHGIAGELFIQDTKTLVIENFSYDGLGPATFAYYYPPGAARDRTGGEGVIIPVPGSPNSDGRFPFGRTARYTDETLVLPLPAGVDVCDIGEFTLWCRPFRAFFTALKFDRESLFLTTADDSCVIRAHAVSPTTLPPTTLPPTTLPPTTTGIGGVEVGPFPNNTDYSISGTLHILDPQTLFIEGFSYDGNAPGAYLYYFVPGQVIDPNGGGIAIPVPNSDEGHFVRRYDNEDLLIPLPEGTTACDIGTLTIWCRPFTIFFTVLEIPAADVFVPGAEECELQTGGSTVLPFQCPNGKFASSAADCIFDNCVPLHSELQLSWTAGEDGIDFRLCGCQSSDRDLNQYMGFGLSGSSAVTSMFGADPVITWVDDLGPHAVDYYLSGYFQCRGGRGACPDTEYGGGCADNVVSVSGSQQGGEQCVIYRRTYNTSDSACDSQLDPSTEQYIVWGVGGLSTEGLAFQHFIRASAGDAPVLFNRPPADQCSRVELTCGGCPPFEPAVIEALEDTTFTVKIGPSGADRGYAAITGLTGWGISLYINNTLVPELVVQRGRTYTFIIEAGDNEDNLANYHPVYLTNDQHGSYQFKSDGDKKEEIVYAGIDENGLPTAAGRLCKCTEGIDAAEVREGCGSREEYESSLDCSCSEGEAAILTWTPDSRTEDTVYYQCAVHLNLGWRIRVQDPPDPCFTFECPSHASCESYRSPFGGSLVPFCIPSCELNNGGCGQDEVCRLVPINPLLCLFDAPCLDEVQCSPKDPCANASCPSYAICRVFEPTGEAYCEPSCELENGGCAEGEVCSLLATPCARPPPDMPRPCPMVAVCSQPTPPPDPCLTFECPSHASCESFRSPFGGSLFPFCVPSCGLENGGCGQDEVCRLVPTLLCPTDVPCPDEVQCSSRDPCAAVRCEPGYQCTVHSPTNSTYCEPSCDLQNGGCPRETHCILRANQECEEGVPCPPLRSCCPYPKCDMEFCADRSNRRALCISPYGSECGKAGGEDNCPIAFCHTCYFSRDAEQLPGDCGECPSYTDDSKCARGWGRCVRRAHHDAYGQAWPKSRLRVEDDFRCHTPPCNN